MALRRDMPIRDPQRAEQEPQHSRGYDAESGGWTHPQPEDSREGGQG